MDSPWSVDSVDDELMDNLVKAIVGFTIDVEQIEGKWKLNQNHDQDRRDRVINALRDAGGSDQLEIAQLMEDAK